MIKLCRSCNQAKEHSKRSDNDLPRYICNSCRSNKDAHDKKTKGLTLGTHYDCLNCENIINKKFKKCLRCGADNSLNNARMESGDGLYFP